MECTKHFVLISHLEILIFSSIEEMILRTTNSKSGSPVEKVYI